MNKANMEIASHQVGAPRQLNNMAETAQVGLDDDLDFLNLKEVAGILRVTPISVYRLIAKQGIPFYRTFRKLTFKRKDVLEYLKQHRKEPDKYGSPQA